MSNKNLFGDSDEKWVKSKARGYASIPASGKKGETCKTCNHSYHITRSRKFYKCDLVKATAGFATDILINAPACSKWGKKEDK